MDRASRSAISALLGGVVAALIAAALAFVPATGASAHDYLVSSTPEANSTVAEAPSAVTLTFDDIVLDEGGHGALVQVTDASGRNFETGCASVEGREVSVPVALGAAGAYRVTWQVVSADGHPVSDSLQFTYRGQKVGAGRVGPIAKCGTTVAAPKAQATQAPEQASISPTAIVIIAVAGGIVVLALVAVLLVVVLSARKRNGAPS
ncbi:hypothetical protein GCM10022286_18450 [Gryllotalpicola daejeonensis]|uniref:CopC domain-containing protein n=1 Tax=Gryllotalpicola daejeonensis TaxID=993087 RepID=A0ABP7ZK93_9MICO